MGLERGDGAVEEGVSAVLALGAARLRGAESGALRARLASGELSAEAFYREVVREWARDGVVDDELYQHLLGLSARVVEGGDELAAWDLMLERRAGSTRRSRSGAFYTPPSLVEWVLDVALDPAIADARARGRGDREAVLGLRVCDPACGSGRFLVGAARRMGEALAADRARGREVSAGDRGAALRDVVRECVYGVDVDDVAVGMCRGVLGRLVGGLGGEDDEVRGAVTAHVRVGDSLMGAPVGEGAGVGLSRESADAWCARFFGGAGAREFFHWGLEFGEVFAGSGAVAGGVNASPSHDVLDAPPTRHAFPPPPPRRCGVGSCSGFDVVAGNPPFLNQLASATAVDAGARALLRARFDGAVRGYADTAAAFLLLAMELVRQGGRVGFVLPRSLLAVAHAGRVRARVLSGARPTALWAAPSGAFEGASVATCAVGLHKGGARTGVMQRASGVELEALAPVDVDADELGTRPSWSHLLADADGIPNVVVRTTRTIGDLADATADFRDQYYGLVGYVIDSKEDHPRRPKLITSGLIAPLESLWGRVTTRVHKRTWMHPRVDLDAIEAAAARGDADARMMSAWAKARLVPKLLMATQTRVLEVLVDAEGELLPCVPVVTIVPKSPGDLSMIAELLSSPAMSAVALTRHAGAGMSADAIKLSAKQVLALPAIEEWRRLDGGGGDALMKWWSGRAPRASKGGTLGGSALPAQGGRE